MQAPCEHHCISEGLALNACRCNDRDSIINRRLLARGDAERKGAEAIFNLVEAPTTFVSTKMSNPESKNTSVQFPGESQHELEESNSTELERSQQLEAFLSKNAGLSKKDLFLKWFEEQKEPEDGKLFCCRRNRKIYSCARWIQCEG